MPNDATQNTGNETPPEASGVGGSGVSKKLLVTGASGFVGRHVCRMASGAWQVTGLCRSRPEAVPGGGMRLDLTDLPTVTDAFGRIRPDAVIHLAAMSGLAACQKDPGASYDINVKASRHIASLCAAAGIACVFASTDIVFDGRHPPYDETDPVDPVCVYGEHKALAERAMREAFPGVTLCRLSLVFGMDGRWLRPDGRAMAGVNILKLFVDEYRTPVRVERAAEGLLLALEERPDVLHLGGCERISRYDFGLMTAKLFSYRKGHLEPSRQADVDLGAPRPADVSLKIDRARALGFHPAPLRTELTELSGAV